MRKKPAGHFQFTRAPPFCVAIVAMMCAASERALVDRAAVLATGQNARAVEPMARHSATIVRRFWFRYEQAELGVMSAASRYRTELSRSSSSDSSASS